MTHIDSMIRAFFAIDFTVSIKEQINNEIITRLKKSLAIDTIAWVSANNLHITLQFMSMFKVEDLTILIESAKIKLKNYKPFYLWLDTIELFPNEQKPKVISMTVKTSNNELDHLSQLLGEALEEIHYPVEKRQFRAHLTLGKIHNTQEKILLNANVPTFGKMLINEVTLFQSKTSIEGSHYIPLMKIFLN